jgi:hypothetical protein
LTEERRLKIDPAEEMLRIYRAKEVNVYRTPSRQEYERLRLEKDEALKKSDIKLYLQKFEPESLESMINSKKSTKKLEGGPMIYDKKSPLGKPRRGFSIPVNLRNNTTVEFGIASYKKGNHSQLKEVLAN